MEIVDLFLSAIIQVVVFSIIPFVWWIISERKNSKFLDWLGFRKIVISNHKKYYTCVLIMIGISFLVTFIIFPLYIDVSDNATNQFEGGGLSALVPALIFSFIRTGLSEELFFRGFLAKRFISKLGFKYGNIVQGLIFGLLHGIFFFKIAGVFGSIIITFLTGMSGWISGWINEKQSGGSILSSWLLHGLGNFISCIAAMFKYI